MPENIRTTLWLEHGLVVSLVGDSPDRYIVSKADDGEHLAEFEGDGAEQLAIDEAKRIAGLG